MSAGRRRSRREADAYLAGVLDGLGACRKPRPCLDQLAEGWITAADLCPQCTRRFMAALDREHGTPLNWHQNYLTRSTGEGQS